MSNKRYNTEKALQIILEPDSDSELSDLSESENEDSVQLSVPPRIREDFENEQLEDIDNEEILQSTDEIDNQPIPESSSEECEANDDDDKIDTSRFEKAVPRWRSNAPPITDHSFDGDEFSLPPDDVDTWTPLRYFQNFWNDDLNVLLAEQTNLYSVQKKGTSINTTSGEIEQFIGMQMYMSIIAFPVYRMYWANETRYNPIADIMSRNRYQQLRELIHVSDNLKKDESGNKDNKLYKIQPVLEHVRNNCIKIEPEREHSIDEQIIPAKTKYSGIRQYNPKKPVKWGFKNFVRAGSSGIMYDFFLYTGKVKDTKVTGTYVVETLLETLPRMRNFKVFYDNWFSSVPLCVALKRSGYLATATLRSDRTKNCPLPTEKDIKKRGRGSHSFRTDANSGITITKWYDNKCVQLISNHCDPQTTNKIKRWDRQSKTYIEINCPTVVQEYNKSMGGVDLADMLISLYRTSIKTKRWYLKVLFHCVDIAKVNAWLLYRRHCDQGKIPKKSQLSLLKFTTSIAFALTSKNTIRSRSVGRPSRSSTDETIATRKRKIPTQVPIEDVRYDKISHWPEFRQNRNKCRHCKTGTGRVYCKKCNLCLCLSNARNCFYDFHQT